MPHSFIADRAHAVDASGIRKVFDLAAKLKDPINLSIGLPDFDVPDVIKAAAHKAIDAGHNRYTPTQGTADLRARLLADLTKEYGRDVGEVLITSGVSGALMLAIMATVNPGDEVIFLDPYFVMYKHLLSLVGGKPVIVDSHPDFRFPADKVEAAITPKTKLIILNSPSNPTGTVMTPDEVRAAVAVAKKHNLLILSDEIYEPFLYDGKPDLYSPLSLYENTVVLRGFSKSHAMTGWRVGYVYGHAEVVAQMTKLQQYTFVCAPSPFQDAALVALDVDMSGHVADYTRKRDTVYSKLKDKFEIVRPGGAFYIYPKVPAGVPATEFVEKAIANNVLIIPGNVFSQHNTHFRISYATTDEKLAAGCDVLNSLV
ncbi:MAG: aminotransferase class I/II-fold pyridoxal phosphate-dependent enzyme [Tepidisphaeraceae bacterium]